MNSIIVKPNSKYWNNLQLVSKFPPHNTIAWVWGAEGRTQYDRDADRFFVANTDYPITDPWKRPLVTWQTEGTDMHNEWMLCDDQDEDINNNFYYRYASVQSKLVKLYLYMSV
jgi:hypothetical protein